MPIKYDKLLELMKEKGLTSYKIKQENIIGQATFRKIKDGGDIDTRTIAKLCAVLECQPGDLMEYIGENGQELPFKQVILNINKETYPQLEEEAQICGDSVTDYIKKATEYRYYDDCGEKIKL